MTKAITTGIDGLDAVLNGGWPIGELSVIRGASGTGKTIIALAFAAAAGQAAPCVFASFDEDPDNLATYALNFWGDSSTHFLDFRPDLNVPETGGAVEIGGVLARLDFAMTTYRSTRLVLDGIDILLSSFNDPSQLRRDLFHLIDWCRERKTTLVLTAGADKDYVAGTHPVDYMAHCVVNLRQQIDRGLMTRILHVRKLRGGSHGTNDYPYLIDQKGIFLNPVTGVRLSAEGPTDRVSTGLTELDEMLGGSGVSRGSAIMISGETGTGKTLLCTSIAAASCQRAEPAFYITFEESCDRLSRNSKSAGIDIVPYLKSGMLQIRAHRTIECGIEEHLLGISREALEAGSRMVIVDPVSALSDIADLPQLKNAILRLSTQFVNRGITVVMTDLLADSHEGRSNLNLSSAVDTWIRLERIEQHLELVRSIRIVKSRGSATSKQIKEFLITGRGIEITDPYAGQGEMVFGSAKQEREAIDLHRVEIQKATVAHIDDLLALMKSESNGQSSAIELERQCEILELEFRRQEIISELDINSKILRIKNQIGL